MKDEGPDSHMHADNDGPIGESREATNILIGLLCGHVENLVIESNRANRSAAYRHDHWQETLEEMGQIQVKAQKSGAKVVMFGICIMATIISVVVSVVVSLLI